MNLNGKITFLVGSERTTIEVEDEESNVTFLKITLTPEQLSSALSRLAYTPCSLDVKGLDKVGKKMEHKTFEFEIPESLMYSKHSQELNELAQSKLSDGWVSDEYFGSQNSFRKDNQSGVWYARTIIRRWI